MIKKRLLAIVLLVFVSIGGVLNAAESLHMDKEKKVQARKEMRDAFADFAKKEIFPSLRQWKATLDGAMNAEDLAKLNELRKKGKTMRENIRTASKAMRQAWKNEDYEALKQHREKLENAKDDAMRLALDVKPLAKKYRATLEKIGEEAKVKAPQWRDKGREIMRQWMEKYDIKPDPEKMEGLKKRFGFFGEGDSKKAIVRFMLWDGTEDFGPGPDDDMPMEPGHGPGRGRGGDDDDDIFGMASPNPFSESTAITFTLEKSQHVLLDVFDAQGNKVTTLVNSTMGEGTHSIPFRPENASSGLYTYTLQTEVAKTSGQLSLNR